MIINTIGMKKDKRFEKLYALMGQDLNIIQMPDIAYQYDGSHWEKLLQYSERHYSFCEEKGLLFPVLHKVHWGMYPECEYTYNQKELLMVLEEVVRTDGFSKLTWMEQDYFEHQMCLMLVPHTAYTKAAPSYISECHEYYMTCKSDRVLCGNNGLFTTASEEDQYPETYESIIKEILPDANTWPAEFWLGEKKIYEGLAETYGLVYSNKDHFEDGEDYTALVCLLEQKQSGKEFDIHTLVGMKTCTMAMAAVIWPQETERKMIEAFCGIGTAVLEKEISSYDLQELSTCWLYKTVCRWLDKNIVPSDLDHKAKVARFNMKLLGA